MSTVIYPGSFNPITFGHVDIIERAANLFDDVIVAVAEAVHKKTLFELDERLELTRVCFEQLDNVRVISYQGLLVDLYTKYNAKAVVRGIRDHRDFDYEKQLADMNRLIANSHDFESIFLTPNSQYAAISSTMVREIAKLHGKLESIVPEHVKLALEHKFKL
jgi:pantetheine-phosphate adenylyltransferase